MNNAKYVSFSSKQNLDKVPAGHTFKATWRLQNSGGEAWGDGYKLVHIHADTGSTMMASKASFDLAEVASRPTVDPGTQVDISLDLTAPARANRRYFTDWQLLDSAGRSFGEVVWLRLVTTTAPAPVTTTPTAPAGTLNCQFVEDHSVPDGTIYDVGDSFTKQWVVRNSGSRAWGDGFHLVFTGGDRGMTGSFSHPVPAADPGDEVVISVDMVAPAARTGAYQSSWRIYDDKNTPFGDSLWVKIYSRAKRGGGTITAYSQNDPAWKNKTLGHGPKTIGQFGCMMTCFAMMLTAYGEPINPPQLNDRFMKLTQYGFSGSNLYFVSPAYSYDHIKFMGNFKPYSDTGATYAEWDSNIIRRIDQSLAAGQGVVIQVDFTPATRYDPNVEQHWVLPIARTGNDYLVIDPVDGRELSLLSRYGVSNPPANAEEAMKGAIKSALFYQSTSRTMVTALSFADIDSEPDLNGISELGEPALVYTGPLLPAGGALHAAPALTGSAADYLAANQASIVAAAEAGADYVAVAGADTAAFGAVRAALRAAAPYLLVGRPVVPGGELGPADFINYAGGDDDAGALRALRQYWPDKPIMTTAAVAAAVSGVDGVVVV